MLKLLLSILVVLLVGCNTTKDESVVSNMITPGIEVEAISQATEDVIENILGPLDGGVERVESLTEFLYKTMHRRRSKDSIRKIVINSRKLEKRFKNVNSEMILAIISVESHFNPEASFKGSFGLMQVEAKSHLDNIRGRDIFDVYVNMEVGTTVYSRYYKEFGNNRATLLAYNAGPTNYRRGDFNEEYYTKVIYMYDSLKSLH